MKIYELPYEIRKYVFKLQVEAGNRPDASLELVAKASEGNFDWHKTTQNYRFWSSINQGWYNVFYKTFPNPDYLDHPQNLSFADHLTEQVIKECPINLSENAQDDLKTTLNKVFDGYSIQALFQNRHEIIDDYRLTMRKHVEQIANEILSKDFYYEQDGQKCGYSVMLRRFIAEKVELDNVAIDQLIEDVKNEHSKEFIIIQLSKLKK